MLYNHSEYTDRKKGGTFYTFLKATFRTKKDYRAYLVLKAERRKTRFPFKGTAPLIYIPVYAYYWQVNLYSAYWLVLMLISPLIWILGIIWILAYFTLLYFLKFRISIIWIFDLIVLSLNGTDYWLCYQQFQLSKILMFYIIFWPFWKNKNI